MRLKMRNGVIEEPASLAEAQRWIDFFEKEIPRIEAQITDPNRRLRFGANDAAYEDWRRAASRALDRHRSALAQYRAWLSRNTEGDVGLLRQAHALLEKLRDEVDYFEDEELELVARIAERIGEGGRQAAST